MVKECGEDLVGDKLEQPFVWVVLDCPNNSPINICASPGIMGRLGCSCNKAETRYVHKSIVRQNIKDTLQFVNDTHTAYTKVLEGKHTQEQIGALIGLLDKLAIRYGGVLDTMDALDKLEERL